MATPPPPAPNLDDGAVTAVQTSTESARPVKRSLRQLSVWTSDADIESGDTIQNPSKLFTLLLAYQSLGVVFGDLGTSPLYVFASTLLTPPTESDVIGVASLVIWAITAIVAIKYCLIVLVADDHGQGGTFALFSQLRRQDARALRQTMAAHQPDWRQRLIQSRMLQRLLRVFVVLGVGTIMGDGVLTPAVTVVSACEGIAINSASVTRNAIVGISCGILVLLFLIQRFGTAKVSMLFAPVTVIWFAFNTGVGFYNIFKHSPSVFRALSPHYGFVYLVRNGKLGWESLSGVLLCFTGTEALFADLGHFNHRAIQIAFLGIVYPSLLITYLGQAAYLTKFPENVSETFYKALPGWTYWPGFVIATLAAIVASQALISASFQIIKQAISADFLPHFSIKQTSKKHSGQVYIPVVNWLLMVLTIIVVTTFKTSIKIGRAYGLAVICDMLLTTHFMCLIMITVWRKNLLAPISFYVFFGAIEFTFLSSALLKVPTGGWFSIMMSVIYAYVMLLWRWGSSRKDRYFASTQQQMGDLFRVHRPKGELLAAKADRAVSRARGSLQLAASGVIVKRIPGIGIYYANSIYGVPHALTELVTRLPMLPELVIALTNRFVPISEVLPQERFLVEQQGMPGFVHVVARYGYTERVVQGPAFVQALLESVMGLICRTLRITLVQSEILKAESEQALSEDAAKMVDGVAGDLYGKTHNSLLNADSSDPLSVCMTGIDTEMRRRRTRRPTIIGEDGQITWPAMGTAEEEGSVDDSAAGAAAAANSARRPPRLTFPQEMQHFADKVSRVVAASDATAPLVQRAGDLAGELALVASAAQNATITYVLGRSHFSLKQQTRWNLLRTYLLEEPFKAFVVNTGEPAHKTFGVPTDKLLEVGLIFDLSASQKELKQRSD